ncbi:MAG: phosphoglucosamine mutase [Phycisphaerae bacterium]|nr:phosphoglucosamine mutase [Phycisphaerae bacterium]
MSLMMSISGIRGIVGQTLTPTLAAELGLAFGTHLSGGRVAIGRDTRPSGPMVQRAVVSGLLAAGCDVIDLGVVTTPGTALMVGRRRAAGGAVITASHNPIVWNGVKFLSSQGFAPPSDEAQRILDRFRRREFVLAPVERIGSEQVDASTHEAHVTAVLAVVDVEAIRRRRFRVVLDSVNGAGGTGGRMLLERLGCDVVHINAEPSGRFAHTPEPIAENLTGLCDAVRTHGAAIGFAQDPDADRLAIVDEAGRYIGEEYTLALAARRIFARQRGPAAANLSTSRMIDDLAAQAGVGCRVIRTPVGEAHVARAMIEHRCIVGGEGNGGVILPAVILVRDSFVAMALALELMTVEDATLGAIVDRMPRYAMIKQKFEADAPRIAAWLQRVRDRVTDGRINDADGLRIDWEQGWVHVRPSNTEPIARVIAEARDTPTAEALARRVTDLL